MPGCKETVFLGCEHCPSFLCYDHMETGCIEHTRTIDLVVRQSENISLSSDSDTNEKKKWKRKREKREKRANLKNGRKMSEKLIACLERSTNSAGTWVRAKCVLPCICHHGRQKVFKCEEFTEDDRYTLNSEYYAAGDYSRQRDLYSTMSEQIYGWRACNMPSGLTVEW